MAQMKIDPVRRGRKYNAAHAEGRLAKTSFKGMEFRLWTNEKVYTDELKKTSFAAAYDKLNKMQLNGGGYAPLILRILASFGGASQLDTLAEAFLMYAGHRAGTAEFSAGVKDLLSLSLINGGTLARGPQRKLQSAPVKPLRFVYITKFGVSVFTQLNGPLPLVETNERKIDAAQIKSALISSKMVCRLLHEGMLTRFDFGRAHASKAAQKRNKRTSKLMVRPLYTLNMKGTELLFFSFRKTRNWEAALKAQLEKCTRIFRGETPVVILATEDFIMSVDAFKLIASLPQIKLNVLFTDDITFLNSNGKQFLYTIDFDGGNFKRNILGK